MSQWAVCCYDGSPTGEFSNGLLESIRDQFQVWQSFRSIILIAAQWRKASALRFIRSQSLAKRRHRLSQPMVRSTIHRLGNTTNLPVSERLTISTFTPRHTRARRAWNYGPW